MPDSRDRRPRFLSSAPTGRRQYYLDMGWADLMLAVEYDGEHHRTDPVVHAYDVLRAEDLAEVGWTMVTVVKQHRSADVLRRVERAWQSKLRGDRELA